MMDVQKSVGMRGFLWGGKLGFLKKKARMLP
jgi:hypothetical protein